MIYVGLKTGVQYYSKPITFWHSFCSIDSLFLYGSIYEYIVLTFLTPGKYVEKTGTTPFHFDLYEIGSPRYMVVF